MAQLTQFLPKGWKKLIQLLAEPSLTQELTPSKNTLALRRRTSCGKSRLAYYVAGMSVNYDKIVSGDGYQWLSYLSYNGNRRYVAVAKLAQQESKPSGTINIENLSNLGFDVHITNVSGGDKAIQSVSVPVWTAKDGQDDLVWHQADRQSDGSYKVRINVSDHKAEAGEYIVHLYYVQDGKMVGIRALAQLFQFKMQLATTFQLQVHIPLPLVLALRQNLV